MLKPLLEMYRRGDLKTTLCAYCEGECGAGLSFCNWARHNLISCFPSRQWCSWPGLPGHSCFFKWLYLCDDSFVGVVQTLICSRNPLTHPGTIRISPWSRWLGTQGVGGEWFVICLQSPNLLERTSYALLSFNCLVTHIWCRVLL